MVQGGFIIEMEGWSAKDLRRSLKKVLSAIPHPPLLPDTKGPGTPW